MQRLGRYELLEQIGRGGMGAVYRARDPQVGRTVAVKLLLGAAATSPTGRKRFAREAHALARVEHPHVVRAFDYAAEAGAPYLVMEWVEGESLQTRLDHAGPLAPEEAARQVATLCDALVACHEAGILHRDLKPANVLVTSAGELKLTDFGLVRDTDPATSRSALTEAGHLLGSPGFWAPEQAQGQLDQVSEQTDVYGLGGLLFALLTGFPPHQGESLVDVLQQALQPPPAPSTLAPAVPNWLDRVVGRALALDPAARYAGPAALGEALEAGLAPAAGGPLRAAWVAAAVLCVGGLLGAGVIVHASRRDAESAGITSPASPRSEVSTPPPSVEPAPAPADADVRASQDAVAHGLALYGARRFDLAVARADEALVLWSDNAEAYVLRAASQRAQGRVEEAIADYDRAILLEPNHGRVLSNRGYARLTVGDAAGAVGDFERALALEPEASYRDQTRQHLEVARAFLEGRSPSGYIMAEAQGYVQLGADLLAKQRFTEALEAFDQALAIQPSCAPAYLSRGEAWFRVGELERALEDIERALRFAPDSGPAYAWRGVCHMRLGDWERAIPAYTGALKRGTDVGSAHFNRGMARLYVGDRQAAREDLDAALALDPAFAMAYVGRASARAAEGDVAGGIADYERALGLSLPPDQVQLVRHVLRTLRWRGAPWHSAVLEGVLQRGMSLRTVGRNAEALEAFSEVIRAQPDDAPALFHRGSLWIMLGDRELGIADLTQTLRLDPDQPLAWHNRGVARLALGDAGGALADAEETIERARALGLTDSVALGYHQRGLVHEAQQAWSLAADDFTRALELAPNAAWAADARARLAPGRLPAAGAGPSAPPASPTPASQARLVRPERDGERFREAERVASQGEQLRARELYLELAHQDPSDYEARTNAAVCLLSLQQFDDAKLELEALVAAFPDVAIPRFNLGVLELTRGDLRAALPHVERALELDPDVPGAWRTRGNLRLLLGDPRGAIEDFERALQRDPDDLEPWQNMAEARFQLRDYAGAVEAATECLERAERLETRLTRAACLGLLGRYAEALADAERCMELSPADPRGYRNACAAARELGDRARVQQVLERGLAATNDPVLRQAWEQEGFSD